MADKKPNASDGDKDATAINKPFSDPAPELGETPGPVPAQTFGEEPKDSGEKPPLPRNDVVIIQDVPEVTARTVVTETTAPPTDEQTITEATFVVAPVPSGGFGELARLMLGDVQRAPEIAALNKDKIINPDAVIVGTVVRVPGK